MFDFLFDAETKSFNRGLSAGRAARKRSDIQEAYEDGYKAGFGGQDLFLDDDDQDDDE